MSQDFSASVLYADPLSTIFYENESILHQAQTKSTLILKSPVPGIHLTQVNGLRFSKVTFLLNTYLIFFYSVLQNIFFFLQEPSLPQFKFFKIQFDALQCGPNTLKNTQLCLQFNKNLPPEIIHIIMSYLPPNDLLNLAISKLFLPALLSNEIFFRTLKTYFVHVICQHFKNHPKNFSILPVIFENHCYLAINTFRMQNFRAKCTNLMFGFRLILERFSMIFESYQYYKLIWTKYEHSSKTLWATYCASKNCKCTHFLYSRPNSSSSLIKRQPPQSFLQIPLEEQLNTNYRVYYDERGHKMLDAVVAVYLSLCTIFSIVYVIWATRPTNLEP